MPGLSRGYLGVDFFFLLSGLIISHVYLHAMLTGKETYARFLLFRFARLWPVHAFLMICLLAAAFWSGSGLTGEQRLDWFSLTFLIHQWLLPDAYVWNAPAWSVSAEIFAYVVLFPIIISICRRWGPAKIGPWLALIGVTVLAALALANNGSLNAISNGGPLIRVTGGFLVGAGLYGLAGKMARSNRWDRVILASVAGLPVALWVANDLGVLTVLAALTTGAYMASGRVARLLSAKPLYLLGEWSFSLYLAHVPILIATQALAVRFDIYQGVLFCLGSLALSILAAALLYYFLEMPARKALRYRVEHGRPSRNAHMPALAENQTLL